MTNNFKKCSSCNNYLSIKNDSLNSTRYYNHSNNSINCKKYKNCNICYNCNCHKYPGHFMSVQRLNCKNNLINLNVTFNIN